MSLIKFPNILLFIIILFSSSTYSGSVDLREYGLLITGMSEAEVLYRLGPYDHEAIYHDGHRYVQKKIWYYIPDGSYSGDWITEITFDSGGRIRELNRFKPRP